uniref:Uncharacterized protein n=1 Tax=Cannabis sativa TaxID=3483 RepID=A0A803QN66_CANSA
MQIFVYFSLLLFLLPNGVFGVDSNGSVFCAAVADNEETVIGDIFTEKVRKVTALDPKFRSIKFLLSREALIESSAWPRELRIPLGIPTPYPPYFIWPDFLKCALRHLNQTPEPLLIEFSEDHSAFAETLPRHLPKMRLSELTIEEIEAQNAARRKRMMSKSPKRKSRAKKSKGVRVEENAPSDLGMSSQHDSATEDAIGALLSALPEVSSGVGEGEGNSEGLAPAGASNLGPLGREGFSQPEILPTATPGLPSSSPARTSASLLGVPSSSQLALSLALTLPTSFSSGRGSPPLPSHPPRVLAEWDEIPAFRIKKDAPFEESAENYFKTLLDAVRKPDDDFYISRGRFYFKGYCHLGNKDRERESLAKGYSRYKKNYETAVAAKTAALTKISALEVDVKILKSKANNLESEKRSWDLTRSTLESEKGTLSGKVASLETSLLAVNLEKATLLQECDASRSQAEAVKDKLSSLSGKLFEVEKALAEAQKALVAEKESLAKEVKILMGQVKKAFLSESYQSSFKLYSEFKEGKSDAWNLDEFFAKYSEFKKDEDLVDSSSESDEGSRGEDDDGA